MKNKPNEQKTQINKRVFVCLFICLHHGPENIKGNAHFYRKMQQTTCRNTNFPLYSVNLIKRL